uniref:Sperm surface protein Sp17 n=1 Tax=Pyxicephalus adspersus TaxID=30357 RepID=A0AAV2ZHC0_PYXAD|nr:TPA: hypothetical protein GDO54_003984 [Pyxicephalus adspersus]
MAIPFSNTNYRIPRGFANLLEGLTREVLREQPKDIPLFAAKYFSDLLRNREESGFDPAEWGASLEDRFYNNKSFQETEGSLQDQAATVIQAAVRGHLVRHGAKQLREEEAGNKLNISEPPASDVTSTTQDEDQETARTDVDSATHPELQRVGSAAMLQDISDPEESHEGPTHVTSDSVLQEQHESEQEDRLQVEKEEAEDNEVTSEAMTGDDGVQAADNGDEMSPEHPEAVEPSYSRTEPGADLGTKPQIHDGEQNEEPEALTVTAEQNVQDDSDHIHETTEEEDRNDQTAETAEQHIAEDITEQTAEQSDVVDMAEATGHSNVEDSNDHITETTKLPEIEDSNGATEATDREETGEQKKEINEDQPASAPIPEEESPGGENETCRKHQDEALDIALDDPGANAAATKIQAGFRGHMTRKKMKGSDKELKHKDGKEGSSAEGSIES